MAITNQNQVSFHEATLVAISRSKGRISLSLEDVLIFGTRTSVDVSINNVDVVLRNDLVVESVEMEEDDGEVLGILQQEGQIVLIVQWNNFSDKTRSIVTYKFCGERVVVHVG